MGGGAVSKINFNAPSGLSLGRTSQAPPLGPPMFMVLLIALLTITHSPHYNIELLSSLAEPNNAQFK